MDDFDQQRDPEGLDRLFDQTMRGPFNPSPLGTITDEGQAFPLIPGGVTEEQNWPLSLQSYMRGGFYNDRFAQLPPDGVDTDVNNEDNRIPGWERYYVDADGLDTEADFKLQVVDYGSYNHALEFTLPSGMDSFTYFGVETEIHMPAQSLQYMWPTITLLNSHPTNTDAENAEDLYLSCQVVGQYPDGTELTVKTLTDTNFEAATGGTVYRMPLETAWNFTKYIVRWYFWFTSGEPTTARERKFQLIQPTLMTPQLLTMNLHAYRDNIILAASNTYKGHRNEMGQDHHFIAPLPGFCAAASVAYKNLTLTAGTVTAWLRTKDGSDGTTTDFSGSNPVPYFDKDSTYGSSFWDFSGTPYAGFPSTLTQFNQGDILIPYFETDSSFAGTDLIGDIWADFVLVMFADGYWTTGSRVFTIAIS